MTRSTARATAATVTKRTVGVVSLHSTDDTHSNVYDGVGKTLFIDPLKGKSTSKKDEAAIFIFSMEDYYSSDSSASSPKKVVFLQSEGKSSQTIIMLAMMIGAVNFEEEFASIKSHARKTL